MVKIRWQTDALDKGEGKGGSCSYLFSPGGRAQVLSPRARAGISKAPNLQAHFSKEAFASQKGEHPEHCGRPRGIQATPPFPADTNQAPRQGEPSPVLTYSASCS